MSSAKLSVTVMKHLARKYDAAALGRVDRAVKNWVAADARRGFQTVHVAVDDADAMKSLGVPAVKGKATAAKVKRAIDALWARLTPDYLVLFGGNDIVPHFIVANPSYDPSGDDDKVVPTDNPYASSGPFRASRRGSFLVPDRVVGRIPDMLQDGTCHRDLSDSYCAETFLEIRPSWCALYVDVVNPTIQERVSCFD